MIISKFSGRLANNLIQNIGLSLLGEKLNLKVSNYKITPEILKFNLNLWREGRVLSKKYPLQIFKDKDIDILFNDQFDPKASFVFEGNFQNGKFLLKNKSKIKKMFCYKKESNFNNSKLILMIRLSDVAHLAPPLDFYHEAIADMQTKLGVGTKIEGYIASDMPRHRIVKKLASKYNYKIISNDATDTLKYAIRFRNFILTGGSYHWLAAFLADAKHVIYPEHTYMWHGDIYSQFKWTKKEWKKFAPIRYFLLKNHFWKYDFIILSLRKFKKFFWEIYKYILITFK